MKRLVFIVGLQKSGTNLLVKLLEQSGRATRLSHGMEGGPWGHAPAFSPTEFPAGTIYQRHNGEMGHEIDADEVNPEIAEFVWESLNRHIAEFQPLPLHIGFSKTPYNTVRIPWVRALFPDCFIVGVIRRAVPNSFSLLKRYQPNSRTSPPQPEEGWWGVKPRGWRQMICEDKVMQIAQQWNAVNAKMWRNWACLNMLVWYHDLCTQPGENVQRILETAMDEAVPLKVDYPPLRCCDHEAIETGSRLLPKFWYWKDSSNLALPASERIELGPLSKEQTQKIEAICSETEREILKHTRSHSPIQTG